MAVFDYGEAFSRNLGLIDAACQASLRDATVCIAGMGGVGGDYVASLARSGVGKFKLADFDQFELANFNRQYGASMSTLDRPKVEVMAEVVRDINPEAEVAQFPDGLTEDNLDRFLDGADVVIDAIDLFAPEWHRRLINAATERGLISLAAVPVGFGAGMVAFGPGGMSFDRYFAWDDSASPAAKTLRLALGFAPAGFHLGYLDADSVSLQEKRGPSSVAGCKMCAAMVTTQAVMALLWRKELRLAPWYTHIDVRRNRMRHARLRAGNRGLLQRLKLHFAGKKYL